MTLPTPEPGLVIRYSYLWRAEHLAGREEGIKDGPCAIVMAINHEGRDAIVSVLPITHTPPSQPTLALEIPEPTKRRLQLDSERSWIVLNESNRFVWPGPDLRPLPGEPLSSIAYGMLPPNFFNVLRERYLAAIRAHRSRTVPRTQ